MQKFVGSTKNHNITKRMFSSDKKEPIEWGIICTFIAMPFTMYAYTQYCKKYVWTTDDKYTAQQKIESDKRHKNKEMKDKIEAEFVCKEDDDIQTKIDIKLIKADISQFIKLANKTEKICMYVISQRPEYINFIENPSPAVCMMALQLSPYLIAKIKNPTSDMCMFALQQTPMVINHMKKEWLTNDIIMKAVELDAANIRFLTNPDKELCWAMIRRNPNSIMYIQKDCVTKEMQLEALKLGAKNIYHYTDNC
jgi:hypothetical protein